MNIQRSIWIIIKIFPKINELVESFSKVLIIRTTLLQSLKDIAEQDDYYFLHYTDAPEGPHLKFALKSKDKLDRVLEWKRNKLNDFIKSIEIIIEEDDDSKNLANRARKIVETISTDKIKQLKQIKTLLNSNNDYNILNDDGKHFVRNMLGLTYQDEYYIIYGITEEEKKIIEESPK